MTSFKQAESMYCALLFPSLSHSRRIFLCILSIRHVRPFSQPINGRQFQGRTNKRNEKTLTYSWPTVNESIENLHSISNFDNNLARLANNKSDKVAKKCPTKSSILSGPNELATLRHGTCHITNRRDCRFRQFIVE